MSPLTKIRILNMKNRLQKEFPNHFPMDDTLPLPWDRTLWKAIRARYQKTPFRDEASGRVIKEAMRQWQRQNFSRYLQAMVINPMRYTMNGHPVERISPEKVSGAKKRLAKSDHAIGLPL